MRPCHEARIELRLYRDQSTTAHASQLKRFKHVCDHDDASTDSITKTSRRVSSSSDDFPSETDDVDVAKVVLQSKCRQVTSRPRRLRRTPRYLTLYGMRTLHH